MTDIETRASTARGATAVVDQPAAQGRDGAGAVSVLLLHHVLAGRPVAEARTMVTTALAGRPAATTLSCLLWIDDLAAADRVATEVIELDPRSVDGRVAALLVRAAARLWSGELAGSASDAAAARQLARAPAQRAEAAAWLALCHLESDEPAAAADVLGDRPAAGAPGIVAIASGRLAIERGDADALDLVLEAGRRLRPVAVNPAVLPWRSVAALLAREHRGALARALARAEVILARRFGAGRPLGAALRAAGAVWEGAAGIALLAESVAVLERSPARLELAASTMALGAALREDGRCHEARAQLRAGLELAERCDARRLKRVAREELRLAGARPRRSRTTGLESLTPSERRIALLVGRGLSNREIAGELFVTMKTVEWHLRHLYRKLGVVGRSQLVARVRVGGASGTAPASAGL